MDEVFVECEKLDHFGRGLCHVSGKIMFVPNLLPLEKAFVRVISDKRKYMIGEVVRLVKKSDDRIEPKCGLVNCGCAIKAMNYDKTLEFKKNKVTEILKKYSGLDGVIKEIIPSENVYFYRNKITLKVKDGKIGYFKNDSNELIEVKKCFLASEKINKIIGILKELDLSKVKEIVIKDFDEVMIIIDGIMDIELLKECAESIYMEGKLVYGKEFIIAKLGKFKFYVSKDAFFQVNLEVALKLYNKVLEYLGKSNSVLDLYCGTGTISIFLSKYFESVIGVEINEEAIKCANLNKDLNGINNVRFICGDVSKEIHYLKVQVDSIVVDPPRSGLTKSGIEDILKISPKKMVYVSCDPMTLARDLRLLSSDYEVKEVTLFDMFPWTYHVESVVLCVKK